METTQKLNTVRNLNTFIVIWRIASAVDMCGKFYGITLHFMQKELKEEEEEEVKEDIPEKTDYSKGIHKSSPLPLEQIILFLFSDLQIFVWINLKVSIISIVFFIPN